MAVVSYVLDKENRSALLKQTAALFKDVEGIDEIILPRDFKMITVMSHRPPRRYSG